MGLVVITDHVFPNLDLERGLLESAGHILRYEGDAKRPEDVARVIHEADAILNCYSVIPAAAIRELPRCRIIARYGIGLDTIDVDAATSRGILVTNVPDYCIDEVSDHALALILSLARGVTQLDRSVRSGTWSLRAAGNLYRLRGRTLGLVGFGRIARALAAKAAAIGLRVVAHDPFISDADVRAAGVEPHQLDALLSEADVVSIHAPLSDATRHLIGDRELGLMRPTALLVNTSRGPLVDVEALRRALDAGALAGAALDVLEQEPPAAGDPLLHRPDVIITPHAAFYSEESLVELQRKAVEQVIAALAGDVPPYAVNADALSTRGG